MVPFKIPFPVSLLRVLPVALVALVGATTASAQTLTWNANSETNLAGYRVQYGTVSGSPTSTVDVGRVTSWRITGVSAGVTYYYRVVAYNTSGQTGTPSAQVSYVVSGTPTTPTTTLTATSVAPNTGPTSGGTAITVTGTGFVSGAVVLIDGTPATSVSVVSSTSITARTPAKPAGGYSVQVRNPNGQTVNTPSGFLYSGTTPPPPSGATLTAISVSPNTGPTSGGTAITVTGTGFVSGAVVLIDGAPATSSSVVSSTSITARTPAKPAGGYSVQVRNPNGQTANTSRGFLYVSGASATQTTAAALESGEPALVTRYLAEGVESEQMHTQLSIANPEDTDAHTQLTFMTATGDTVQRSVDVPARSRRTLDLSGVPELAGASFSTVLESDGVVALDRRVSLDPAGRATTVAAAVAEPAPTWYFAEGPTAAPYEQFYLVQNPGDADTQVQVTYLPPDGAEPIVRTHSVAAHSRMTIWVDRDAPGLQSTRVGAEIASVDGAPIVVERTVYTTQEGSTQARGAVTHAGATSVDSAAASEPRGARWLIADAQAGVTVANRGAVTDVTVTLLFEGGPEASATFPVAADGRLDVPFATAFPAAAGRRFSVLVEALDPAANLVVGAATRLP
jgi:hypothetical protein